MKPLYFWSGPMFSGKTTAMLDMVGRLERTIDVMVLRPAKSRRPWEGDAGSLRSRTGRSMLCLDLHNLSDARSYPTVKSAGALAIDEIGIFDDSKHLLPFIQSMLKTKIILVAGLIMTAERKPWPGVSEVLAIADYHFALKADCDSCGAMQSATRTLHVGEEDKEGTVKVGGQDSYVAVCPPCWETLAPIKPDSARPLGFTVIKKERTDA